MKKSTFFQKKNRKIGWSYRNKTAPTIKEVLECTRFDNIKQSNYAEIVQSESGCEVRKS